MSIRCIKKHQEIKDLFLSCSSPSDKYLKIMELGKNQAPMSKELCIEENRVHGCQSIVFLHATYSDSKMEFSANSEALISAGLAELLIRAYSNESPETVLKCPPTFLEELGIPESLTPGRANGLYSMYLHMKQHALKALVAS